MTGHDLGIDSANCLRSDGAPVRPAFDEGAIRAHIEHLHDLAVGTDGQLVLAVYGEDPATGRKLPAKNERFDIGDVDGMVAAVMRREAVPHTNVYVPVSVVRRGLPLNKRGKKTDVVGVLGFVVDLDADTGRTGKLPLAPSLVLETSPGNRQAFFFLGRTLTGYEADPIAVALRDATGADDGTSDFSHVWRVPGTLNWPNRKKVVERARSTTPFPVRVSSPFAGELIDVEELRAVLAPVEKERPRVQEAPDSLGADRPWPEDLLSLIARGVSEGQDRSAAFYHAVGWAKQLDASVDEIERRMRAAPNGIAAKYLEGSDRLLQEIVRAFNKGTPERDRGKARPRPGRGSHGGANGGEVEGVRLEDFHAYMPTHSYIFAHSREMWPAASVNARIPPIPILNSDGKLMVNETGKEILMSASAWLDKHRSVEQMTWAPGQPMLIRDRLVSDGGWIEHGGCTTFNLYRAPAILPGNAGEAGRWVAHVSDVYPDDVTHIVKWLAHRIQRPHEKINHALVLGGVQGIGKDTILEPVKRAIGPWNFAEVSPQQMLGRFNGFVKSVILRVSEARDLGDVDRFAFYDHMKVYTAAPPDVLRVDEKNLREYAVFNVCGVVITTNHKNDGIYLPADDRRHFVAWSDKTQEDFDSAYWTRLYKWYDEGGDRHVAAYLASLDLSEFDAKAPPPKTTAFWQIVDANRAPEDAELADALDTLGNPDAATLDRIADAAPGDLALWLKDRKNRRVIPHRLEDVGYVPVRNPAASDGLWKIDGRRLVVYARKNISLRDRLAAAAALFDHGR